MRLKKRMWCSGVEERGVEATKSDHFFEQKSVIMAFSSLLFTEAAGTAAETRNGGENERDRELIQPLKMGALCQP